MEEASKPEPAANCCGGESNQAAGAACSCCAQPTPRRRIKTLVAVLVILAAAGVGTYSLLRRPAVAPCAEQGCGADSSGCCGQK